MTLPCVLRVLLRVLVSGCDGWWLTHLRLPAGRARRKRLGGQYRERRTTRNVSASPPRAAGLPPRVRAPRTHDAGRAGRAGGRAGGAGGAGWVHLRPRRGPANSLSAVRVRGRRAVVKDIGVRMPNQ